MSQTRGEHCSQERAGGVESPIQKRWHTTGQIGLEVLDREAENASEEPGAKPPESGQAEHEEPSQGQIDENVRQGVAPRDPRGLEEERQRAPLRSAKAGNRVEARVDDEREVSEKQEAPDSGSLRLFQRFDGSAWGRPRYHARRRARPGMFALREERSLPLAGIRELS
jgi:hypothetical protein